MYKRQLYAWSGYRTNEVHFQDVRVPLANLVGEVNGGWKYITGALDLERGALTNAGDLGRAVDDLFELAARPRRDGTVPADSPALRRRLAQAEADVEVATLMGYEAASILDSGVTVSYTHLRRPDCSPRPRQAVRCRRTRSVVRKPAIRPGRNRSTRPAGNRSGRTPDRSRRRRSIARPRRCPQPNPCPLPYPLRPRPPARLAASAATPTSPHR